MNKFGYAAIAALVIVTIALGLTSRFLDPKIEARQAIFEPASMVWGFQHMEELFPSRGISTSLEPSALPLRPVDLSAIRFTALGREYGFEDLLAANHTQGLVVIHRGDIVYENYLGGAHAGSRFTSWSVAKSINATLVGIAIGEGLITSVDDPLEQFVSELKGTDYEGVSIRHALQMSSGIDFSEEYDASGSSDVNRFMGLSMFANIDPANPTAASFPRGFEPGTRFNYNTAESQILGWLVHEVSGMPVAHYLQEKIWQPLGMNHDASWLLDNYGPTGMEMTGCCINAALRDFARFGQLYLQDGIWQGERLLPQGWVAMATEPDSAHLQFGDSNESETGYQFQWWRMGPNAYSAEGVHGQFIYVNPVAEVVIAKASAWPEAWADEFAAPAIAGMHAIAQHLSAQ